LPHGQKAFDSRVNPALLSLVWDGTELGKHSNFLELKAIFIAIKYSLADHNNCHIHILTDNSASKHYINNKGGTKSYALCMLTLEIYDLCLNHNVQLSASHIPGCDNTNADWLSRNPIIPHDYSLPDKIFYKLFNFLPKIDLFASSSNAKLPIFLAISSDSLSTYHDAFSISWESDVYIFPPICLINKCINKILSDKTEKVLLITPLWPGLPDLPLIFPRLIADPVLIPEHLLLGSTPTRRKFNLVAFFISNKSSHTEAYQQQRLMRCSTASPQKPSQHTSDSGNNSTHGWKKIGIHLYSPFQ